ncbi:MAG: acyl-CoA dehydrogenase [Bdellovibrionales bacterium]|nr:acyl-CoA dehydrogenase [Bdellovibrionales bacterium]
MESLHGILTEGLGGLSTGLWIGITALLAVILGYTGAPFLLWTVFIALAAFGFGASTPVLAAVAVILVVFNVPALRRTLISGIAMKVLAPIMPAISDTERVALEAGTVGAEGELFSGHPNFKKLMSEPYPDMTPEEKAFIDGPVERLCASIDDWEVWEERDIPPAAWDIIKKERFLGMIIPKEYGGLGFSALAHSEVIKKLCSRSVPACISVMVPNSLGPAELLTHYGTEEQKKKLLPRLATGEEIPCFALTEPGAGSDAGSISAEGILFKGEDGKLYMRLSWNKRWITLAAISTILGLAFRLKDPQNLLGQGEDLGITCALIPTNTPGVVVGKRHDPLGTPFYNCPTQGKDVVASVDTIVGGLEGAGKGWRMLMECLAAGRGVSLPAQSTGGTALVTRVVSAHASIRKQFGFPIGLMEGVEEPIARIGGFNYMIEAMRKYTLGALDKGIKPAVTTAMAKYNATEIGRKVINDGMDIMGGAGISLGPKNLLGHLYIATPIGITVEGANIMTRTLIIFGQGAMRAHPFAYKEVDAIGRKDVKAFDEAFWGHVGHVIHNLTRAVVLSWTRAIFASSPVSGSTARYYKKLSWASATFAIMSDIAMGSLGGSLKSKQMITGRFADILSWMYIGTSVLRRYEAEGRRKEDLPFVHYSMNHALYEIQKSFDGLFANLSVPGLSWFFKTFVRTWSNLNAFAGEANDQHVHKIASLILADTEVRVRHTEGLYIPKNNVEQLGKLEETFRVVKQAEAIERKMRKAVREKKIPKAKGRALIASSLEKGIITQEEHTLVIRAEDLRNEAIQVDSFTQEEFLGHSSKGTAHLVRGGGAANATVASTMK